MDYSNAAAAAACQSKCGLRVVRLIFIFFSLTNERLRIHGIRASWNRYLRNFIVFDIHRIGDEHGIGMYPIHVGVSKVVYHPHTFCLRELAQ